MLTKSCSNCGKMFTTRRKDQKFCSCQCAAESRRGKTYEDRVCPNCGRTFKVEPYKKQKFCSIKCGAEFHKGITYEKRVCLNCGEVFEVEPWKKQKFCSRQCAVTFRRGKTYEERVCLRCGKTFKAEPWKKQKFCSVECGIEYNRGKPRRHPPKCSNRNPRSRYHVMTLENGKKVVLHRYLMERKLGRSLTSSEVVHHIDMDPLNNTIENLYLYPNESEHQKGHASLRKLVPFLLEKKVIKFESGNYYINEEFFEETQTKAEGVGGGV